MVVEEQVAIGDSSAANRFSPFGSLVGDHTESLRQLEGDSFASKWFRTYEGAIASINVFFAGIESEFLAEREKAINDPDRPFIPAEFDSFAFEVWRDTYTAQLLVRAGELYRPYIEARARLSMPLPEQVSHVA